ncbi:MAG: FAD:protein FMN transferase [Paracoccaceae bacterium]
MKRRRFLTITAGFAAIAAMPLQAATVRRWKGVALGAGASIALAHPEADRLIGAALAEIARLERVFSLYRADSELSQLNATGVLDAPSFDMVVCLGLCDQVNGATEGLFDPSVQPLWATYAEAQAQGTTPTSADIAAARARTGWHGVGIDSARIQLRPGMALTLNGVAQGFIADRVADLLRGQGVDDVLIDTGEIVAIGHQPDGAVWPVSIRDGADIALTDRALATSAPLGTVLDQAGRVGHIIDARSGKAGVSVWRQVTVSAGSAAIADALSTAACLMPDLATIERACSAMGDARPEHVLREV